MRDSSIRVWNTEKGSIIISRENCILEIGFKTKSMEVDSIFMKTDKGIWESSSIIWSMDKEFCLKRMDVNIGVSLPTTKDMVLASILMPIMIKTTSKCTKMVNWLTKSASLNNKNITLLNWTNNNNPNSSNQEIRSIDKYFLCRISPINPATLSTVLNKIRRRSLIH